MNEIFSKMCNAAIIAAGVHQQPAYVLEEAGINRVVLEDELPPAEDRNIKFFCNYDRKAEVTPAPARPLMPKPSVAYGDNFIAALEKAGLTEAELANHLDIPAGRIYRFKNDNTAPKYVLAYLEIYAVLKLYITKRI